MKYFIAISIFILGMSMLQTPTLLGGATVALFSLLFAQVLEWLFGKEELEK